LAASAGSAAPDVLPERAAPSLVIARQ